MIADAAEFEVRSASGRAFSNVASAASLDGSSYRAATMVARGNRRVPTGPVDDNRAREVGSALDSSISRWNEVSAQTPSWWVTPPIVANTHQRDQRGDCVGKEGLGKEGQSTPTSRPVRRPTVQVAITTFKMPLAIRSDKEGRTDWVTNSGRRVDQKCRSTGS